MNLTPKRGAPVSLASTPNRDALWRIATVGAGAVLTGYAWRRRVSGANWLKALGLSAVALGLASFPASRRAVSSLAAKLRSYDAGQEMVDEAIDNSFPASDPPALSYGG